MEPTIGPFAEIALTAAFGPRRPTRGDSPGGLDVNVKSTAVMDVLLSGMVAYSTVIDGATANPTGWALSEAADDAARQHGAYVLSVMVD